jgi:hypothetical protein
MKKKIAIVLCLVVMAGCSQSITEPTSRPKATSIDRAHDVLPPDETGSCRSGFTISLGLHGELICVPQ